MPTNQGGNILAIYKVVRMFKHKTHGWIKSGRFVRCRAIFAKNFVTRRELVRCFPPIGSKQDSLGDLKYFWIDSIPEPVSAIVAQKKESGKRQIPTPTPGILGKVKTKGKAKNQNRLM